MNHRVASAPCSCLDLDGRGQLNSTGWAVAIRMLVSLATHWFDGTPRTEGVASGKFIRRSTDPGVAPCKFSGNAQNKVKNGARGSYGSAAFRS
jgi:hypothetical protein